MVLEAIAAGLLGLLALWVILQPILQPSMVTGGWEEPEDPEETRRGIALIALKEIDFDRATGKLSDADHAELKDKYTREAIEALRDDGPADRPPSDPIEDLIAARVETIRAAQAEGAVASLRCPRCGSRPEPDARFCSNCGADLAAAGHCAVCRAPLDPAARFCSSCGAKSAS
jgi:hypothetical protein